MKNNLFKKSMSVFLTALMLLSCWVFVPGEHNHAEAAALETASALYNKTQLNGINTNIDTTMTTTMGKFKDPSMDGDENASYHVSQYGSQHYKNIYYSPTVDINGYSVYMGSDVIPNVDSVRIYYPNTVMLYDGSTKPQMGVVTCLDASSGNYIRALSVYLSSGANGLVLTDHWKGQTTGNLAHIINMHNGSYQFSSDGTEHASYKINTGSTGEWYFYASDIRFDGTLNSDEFVRTIKPTWGFYGARSYKSWGSWKYDTIQKFTKQASNTIYVMNIKGYRDLLSTISTDKTNISNNAGQYTPESVKAYVNAANAILNLNPKNVSQDPSAVTTWGSNMSTALANYNTAKNGLKNREYEVTYDNIFSLADWKYSASSEKANVTTDLTNGKVTVQNTNASGEYVTPHSGNSTNANTRNTSNYAMPVVGGQEYVFKYTTDHADTQMFAFFYDANGGHTGTYGAYNLTVKNGTGQATFKAPDDATQMEIRFDNNTGATTANFWDIMIYPAAVKTENDVDSWTNRPIRTLYTYNASVGTLPTPARPGYIFDGWKEDTDGDGIGDAAISGNVTKSRVLYSTWKPGTMDVGYDNLFSLSAWANTKSNGKGNTANTSNIVVDLDAGTIAVTGKSDAYTTYGGGSDQYHVAVTAGETYIFDYDVTSTNGTYQAFVFFYNDAGSGVTGAIYNGSAQSNAHIGLYDAQPITFTVPSGCTKIGFRVGICGDAEGTATYSNIGVYKKADYDAYAKNYEKVREPFIIGETKNLMNPTREGYDFDGWTLADGTKVTSTDGFNANTVVYANWTKLWTVTYYHGDNTTTLATKTVRNGETVGALPTVVPTKDTTAEYTYEFNYWYANGTKFTADTAITSDLSVFPIFNNIAHSDFVFSLKTASTCTANATVTKKCGNCGYNFGDVIYNPAEDANAASHTSWLAKGHDFTNENDILENSSTGNGEFNTHSIKCARYDKCGETKAVTHIWAGSDPEGATCTTPGTITWKCPCGAERTTSDDIAPDAHNYDMTKGTPNGDSKNHTVACTYNAAHTKSVACTDADGNCECDICGQELIHVYDQQTETYLASAATCVNDATYYYTCQCGKQGTETWTKADSKLDHTFTNYVYNNDAKCGVDGTKTAECDTCDTGATKTITAEGTARTHEFTGAIKDNENGTHSYKCKYDDCDVYGGTVDCTYGEWDTTGAVNHVKTCTACGYDLVGEHSFDAWTSTDADKVADGQHSKTCTVCSKVVTEDCTYTRTPTAESCTADGYTTHVCDVCNHTYKTTDIGKTGHDYTGAAKSDDNGNHSFLCVNGCNTYGFDGVENATTACTYKYTNTADGKHEAECTVCAYSFTEDCSGGQASCTTRKVCNKCNTAYGETDPHYYNGIPVVLDGDKHAYLCEYCSTPGNYGVGEVAGATEDCSGGEATCTARAICDVCGDGYGSFAPHTFNGDAVALDGDVHAYRCSVCKDNSLSGVGATLNATEACSGGTATCSALAVCDVCDDTHGELDANAHKWGDWANVTGTETHERFCEYDATHTETENCVSAKQEVVAPDCEAKGYTINTCGTCAHTWNTDEKAALNHIWGDWVNNGNGTHTRTCERTGCHYADDDTAKTETVSCSKDNATFVVTAPTCTEEGYTTYTCKDCGYTWDDDVTPAAGHKFNTRVATDAYERTTKDCTTDETYWYRCDKCNVSAETKAGETADITTLYWIKSAATGHNFNKKVASETYLATPATCTAQATYYYSCEACGAKGTTTFAYGAKLSHNWTDTETYLKSEADCVNNEVYYKECSYCHISSENNTDETWTKENTLTGHDFDYEGGKTEANEATCTEDGNVEYYTCQVCKKYFDAEGAELTADELVVKKLGHDYVTVEAKPATCEENGYTKHSLCERCGHKAQYKEITATGHSFDAKNGYVTDAENDTHAYKCANCDAYGVNGVKGETVACEFNGAYVQFTDDNGIHSHKRACVCGNEEVAVCADAEADREEATCTENAYDVYICECGYTWTVELADTALGHSWSEWKKVTGKDEHTRICSRGDATETEACTTNNPATSCGSQNICDVCHEAFGEQIAHNWIEKEDAKYLKSAANCTDAAVYYKACATCGTSAKDVDATLTWISGTATGHSMIADYTYDVTDWNAPADFDKASVKAPSCSEEGLAVKYCTKCDYYLTRYDSKDETKHSFGEEVMIGGDCSTGITYKQTCEHCGETKTRVDNNVEHEFVRQLYKAPTCTEKSVELVACKKCGYTEERREENALGHTWGEFVVEKAATCKSAGRGYYICDVCDGKSEKVEIEKIPHEWEVPEDYEGEVASNYLYIEATEAKCTVDGYEAYFKCLDCSYDQHLDESWLAIAGNYKPATGHKDTNNDGKCDGSGCNKNLNDSTGDCGCACHKNGWFAKLIYKILRFFWKLFGIGKSCDCGAIHY